MGSEPSQEQWTPERAVILVKARKARLGRASGVHDPANVGRIDELSLLSRVEAERERNARVVAEIREDLEQWTADYLDCYFQSREREASQDQTFEAASLRARIDPACVLIIMETARYFGLFVPELIAHRRNKTIIGQRGVAIYLCHTKTTASLPHIGKAFNGRDHTTIMSAINNFKVHLGTNNKWDVAAREVAARLRSSSVFQSEASLWMVADEEPSENEQ